VAEATFFCLKTGLAYQAEESRKARIKKR